jgi:hypothetical protein
MDKSYKMTQTTNSTTQQSLSLIESSALLNDNDQTSLSTLYPQLLKTWNTAQVFRTPTEMRVSVLNDIKRPTPDSKYWQAVREQDVFLNELVSLSYEYRKVLLEIRKLERKALIETDDIERELLELEIEHQRWISKQMERTAHHRVREIKAWEEIKSELIPHLKHGADNVDDHQLEAMRLRWISEATLVNQYTPPADAVNIIGLAQQAEKLTKGK